MSNEEIKSIKEIISSEVIRDILTLRKDAVEFMVKTNDRIDGKLELVADINKGKEIVFVPEFDDSVIVYMNNKQGANDIKFMPNISNIPPGIIGIN